MTFAHISLIALCFYLSVQSIYSHSETRRLVTEDGHLTQEDKDKIVQYHNEKRADLSIYEAVKLKSRAGLDVYAPRAVRDLPVLAWSDELEYVAKYLIDDCWYGHRDKPRMDAWRAVIGREFHESESPGENIGSSGYGPTVVLHDRFAPVQLSLDGWWSEHLLYKWAKLPEHDPDFTKTGHFLQMASEDTTHIGCAARYCPDGVYDDGVLDPLLIALLYCNYYPGGNHIGYYPYNNDPPRSSTLTFADVKRIQRQNGINEHTIHGLCQTLEDEGRDEYQYYKCSVSEGVYFKCEILPIVREDFFETAHFTQFLKEKYGWEFQQINEGPTLKWKKTEEHWIVMGLLKKTPSASSASGTMVGAPLHGLSKTRKTPPTTHRTKLMTLGSKFPERSETASGTPMRTVESKFAEKPKAFSKLGIKVGTPMDTASVIERARPIIKRDRTMGSAGKPMDVRRPVKVHGKIGASSTIKVGTPMDTASVIERARPMKRDRTMRSADKPMEVRRAVKVHGKTRWHKCVTTTMGRGFKCQISCAKIKDIKWFDQDFKQFLKEEYEWNIESIAFLNGCKGGKKYWLVTGLKY